MTRPPMHLSPTLYRLAEVIGLPAALRLAETFGGTEVYLPAAPSEDHPVARCVGSAAALRLAAALRGGRSGRSGTRIEVPKADAITQARRNRAIIAAVAAGESQRVVARRHGLTVRWVRAICNGYEDKRQLTLFDPSGSGS